MPRLLKPDPGEAIDRMTILILKMQYGSGVVEPSTRAETTITDEKMVTRTIIDSPGRINILPFQNEHNQLQEYLEDNWYRDLNDEQGDELNRMLSELQEVNHLVWKLTDQAHILKDAPYRAQAQANERAAEVLYLTIELNDKRAQLVRSINELFNIRHQEKIFA